MDRNHGTKKRSAAKPETAATACIGRSAAYIDYMRSRCVELARVLKKTGSFYYHCDWHASQDAVSEKTQHSSTIR
ncbi:MAG: site-specific DNA-methyltransferase [bacterium]|nr:site-specific DNA-methyltransferase [bacterium]